MSSEIKSGDERLAKALQQLEQLRQFAGTQANFWHGLLEAMAQIAGARLAVLLRRTSADDAAWKRVSVWPSAVPPDANARDFVRDLQEMANECATADHAIRHYKRSGESIVLDTCISLQIESASPQEGWVACFLIPSSSETYPSAILSNLKLARTTPRFYHQHLSTQKSQSALTHLSSVLDLVGSLNAQKHFIAVAMTLCNELASRHKCDRTSLGWLEGEYVKLLAISHTEKFERKMEAIKAIEQTMEECLDQDEIIVWPQPEAATYASADHGRYGADQKVQFLCSVPLRVDGKPIAVVTCERNTEIFTQDEQRLLSLSTELAARRLSEMKLHDRWAGARLASFAKDKMALLVGPLHTWAKVTAIAVFVGLAVLFFGKMDYRVEAPFILRTDSVAILSAPFEGYIEEVPVEIGDPVKAGDVLLKLDTRELLLQEAAAAADMDRFTREADKARAGNQLAEMRVAQAQLEQSRVRLDVVRHRLAQSSMKSPFSGIVVEGDLKKRIGAPLKQGDMLFKVARTELMYAESNVKEEDIHELTSSAKGEFAFASQPKLKFPLQITRIEPAAQTKDKDNIFIVRCAFKGPPESWWRPGMSGIAKIEVGRRTFFWVLSHRTIDFLRMYFWW